MKVIFLDIDGVLNSTDFVRTRQVHESQLPDFNINDLTTFQYYLRQIDGAAVRRLDRLLIATGAKVVISSTWRKRHAHSYIALLLHRKGMLRSLAGNFIGSTPHYSPRGYRRGFEIQDWLDAHPEVTSFAILDDDSDMEHLLPWLVRVDNAFGLQDSHIEQVIKLLEVKS